MAARDQHSAGHQHTVARIQTGHGLAQIQPNALRDTRRDQQDPDLTSRTRQAPGFHRIRRCLPVHPRQRGLADPSRIGLHRHEPIDKVLAAQPHRMPDQQLNSRHRAQQARRMRTQRRRYLIEARSVSGIRSASLIMLGCGGFSGTGSRTNGSFG